MVGFVAHHSCGTVAASHRLPRDDDPDLQTARVNLKCRTPGVSARRPEIGSGSPFQGAIDS
jgi:hypothetical protein